MLRTLLVAALLVGPTTGTNQESDTAQDQGCGGDEAAEMSPVDEMGPLAPDAAVPPDVTAPGPPPMGLTRTTGDLDSYLRAISYGGGGDGAWRPPNMETVDGFSGALRALLIGDIADAAARAARLDFQLVEYTDPQRGHFYILRGPPMENNQSLGGTYVWNPQARIPLVVEVPHPVSDAMTDQQGIELFFAADASLLLISGTHRYSNTMASTCQRSNRDDFRRSDPAHSVKHLFHLAHVQAEDTLHEPLFIQLHGFGEDGYKKLKNQCHHRPGPDDPELLINVSEGFHKRRKPKDGPTDGLFAYMLATTVNQDGTIKACLFHRDTHAYGGTQNVQARHTNGSPDPCNRHGTHNSGRFVHVEQSYNTRDQHRDLLLDRVLDTLAAYYD